MFTQRFELGPTVPQPGPESLSAACFRVRPGARCREVQVVVPQFESIEDGLPNRPMRAVPPIQTTS